MTAAALDPARWAPQRLWLARATAWALLLGGWLVLGGLGRLRWPHAAGGQWPVALWLLALGAVLAGVARGPGLMRGLRAALPVSAGLAGLALGQVEASALWLLPAALAWAVLLACASFTVRALRRLQRAAPPAPTGPALAGAVLAWWLGGDLAALALQAPAIGGALMAAGGLLALLLPAGAVVSGGCRAGLFDCSLPLLVPGRWRQPRLWPQAAAALSMLPMMAGLPAMAEWCGDLRWPAAASTALHLAVMLVPAGALSALSGLSRWAPWLRTGLAWRGAGRPGAGPDGRADVLTVACAAVLALGGGALLVPSLAGVMAASLLQGLAWSLAWWAMLGPRAAGSADPGLAEALAAGGRPDTAAPACAAAPGWARDAATADPLRPALLTAGALLLLGLGLDRAGPDALRWVHAALAGIGAAGLAGRLVQRSGGRGRRLRSGGMADPAPHAP